MNETPVLQRIKLLKRDKKIEASFLDGNIFLLSCTYLRVFSPSAEVRGHHGGENILVTGKEDVQINEIEPVGSYAIRLIFDDGHNTGIYTWPFIYDLGINYQKNWKRYKDRIANIGKEKK